MTLLKTKDRLFYFAHIPKTGGSSVEAAMRAAGARRALHFHKRLDFVRCNLQHMHAELFDTFVPPAFYHRGFTVVRHPVARLTSEYRWRQNLDHVSESFGAWVNTQLTRYPEDHYILDNHFRPQVEFIGKKIEVFKFEDTMPQILRQIAEMTGLDLDVGTHRRSIPPKEELVWSPEVRAAALRFYAADFETFGYDYDTEVPSLVIDR